MNIEDLRLPCEHGLTESHEYHDPSHPECDVSFVTGHGHHWLDCPGGRVPTRQELIDMLDITTRIKAEWYRKGMHDIDPSDPELKQNVRMFYHELMAALGGGT